MRSPRQLLVACCKSYRGPNIVQGITANRPPPVLSAPKYAAAAVLLQHGERFHSNGYYTNGNGAWKLKYIGTSVALISSLGVYIYVNSRDTLINAVTVVNAKTSTVGAPRADLPNYRLDAVRKHNKKEGKIWVTYKNGVYDITDLVEGHPGGDKIYLAAGGAIEPFWELYNIHHNEVIYAMLEEKRIGNIHPDDIKASSSAEKVKDSRDPYANEPLRHPALTLNSSRPCNAEPPPELLADSYLTPNQLFFVRNHLPVPAVDAKSFTLRLEGVGVKKPVSVTLSDLKKKYRRHTVVAAVQCAGNRRSDMAKVKGVKGLSWGISAIGNAEWSGVLLSDLLESAGVRRDDPSIRHVIFQGLDRDPVEGNPYEASVPAETALDPGREVLLAYEMNGEALPADHGYPLRVIVPGVVGARQVKWVGKVILSAEESGSHWQRRDYKVFSPAKEQVTASDWDQAPAIQDYPIQSAILQPLSGTTLEAGSEDVEVRGYAWSGGGRGVIRVDVSADAGVTWHEAELTRCKQRLHGQFAWTLWQATVPLPEGTRGEVTLLCKATDTSHNTQPEGAAGIWNVRGLLHNAWHRVVVSVPQA